MHRFASCSKLAAINNHPKCTNFVTSMLHGDASNLKATLDRMGSDRCKYNGKVSTMTAEGMLGVSSSTTQEEMTRPQHHTLLQD
jgi:hypothetical protein